MRFTVLASGSAGNASVVESEGFGLLIDAGLGPRQLATRFADVGLSWDRIDAVLLTHTHTDHWNDRVFAHLLKRRIPLYCHEGHQKALVSYSPSFPDLVTHDLVRSFEAECEFDLAPGLRCRPLPIRHDGGPTFGFRLEGSRNLFGEAPALGYLADLGTWDEKLAESLAGVELLAVEFNHDVLLERSSGRGASLIARVLGDEGHLSNDQATELVRAVLSRPGGLQLRYLVQLHLSRQCNRPELARASVRGVISECATFIDLHTAEQDVVGKTIELGLSTPRVKRRAPGQRAARSVVKVQQGWLPGME